MRITRDRWQFKDEYYGPLLPYIKDENVTDINYNGKDVWIDDLTLGRYKADIELSRDFIAEFSIRVSDAVSENFNQYNSILEAETDVLRISIIHEAVANTGRSISIRKTPIVKRLNYETMISTGYATNEIASLLQHCVEGKMNIVFCGLPGAGKTELLKYSTTFIPSNDRVITIEDSLEIHYAAINEGKDCVELKVNDDTFDHVKAIKACLRQNPQWILLSEARSTEVKYLLESMSTGTHCLTTLHTDDARKVPDRVKNMIQDSIIAERVDNDVHAFVDLAVLVKKREQGGKIKRFIDQMCFFSRENGENVAVMVVDDGKVVSKEIPAQIMRKFHQYNIVNPFAIVGEESATADDHNDAQPIATGEIVSLSSSNFMDEDNDNEENIFVFTDGTHPF